MRARRSRVRATRRICATVAGHLADKCRRLAAVRREGRKKIAHDLCVGFPISHRYVPRNHDATLFHDDVAIPDNSIDLLAVVQRHVRMPRGH